MKQAIIGTLAPAIARRAKVSWIGYGVAAYVALRLAKRYGVGGDLPDRALGFIDDAIHMTMGRGRPFAARA